MKKILYCGVVLTVLFIAAYCFQPLKKGKGLQQGVSYIWLQDWPQLPKDFYLGNPTGIGVDTNGNIIVFRRGRRKWPLLGTLPVTPLPEKAILILDGGSGKIIDAWGAHLFIMPHGLRVDDQNNIWVTDVGLHQVLKFTHNGKLLMAVGEAKVPGNDGRHFNKPTDVAVEKDGTFYVSDGYGNNRIVKFSPSGKFLLEWGKKGDADGELDLPHGIALDGNYHIYVADRENSRIQIFDSTGKFLRKLNDESYGNINAVTFDTKASGLLATDDLTFLKITHRGSDVYVFDQAGDVESRFGRSGNYDGPIGWFHAIAVDHDENLYVGDILNNRILKFKRIGQK